jgi:MFS family permease
MAVIAFLHQNIAFGCLWGSFSVLLVANEGRFSVGRALSSLAIPAIMLATALVAPLTGMLAARFSLRAIMLIGALLTACGYGLLAVAPSYPIYLMAFGLLLGPGFAAAVVLPPTLVVRWYMVNSGRVMGLISAPIVVVLVPVVASTTLHRFGLRDTYLVLAAISCLAVLASLFIVEPPVIRPARAERGTHFSEPAAGPVTMAQMLRHARFWAIILPAIASLTGSIILSAHMVPMFQSWGLSLALAASLLSVQSFVGIFGTVFFGWLADRLGGPAAMLVVVADSAGLWLLLLLHPPFVIAAPLIGLIGFHASGTVPVLGVLLGRTFGAENFSRAYGLMNLVNLPISVLCVPAAALVFARTGSYAGAIIGQFVFLALGAALLLSVQRGDTRVTVKAL